MLAGVLLELDPDGIPVPFLQIGVTDARFFGLVGIESYGFLPMRCRTTSSGCSTSTRPTSASPQTRSSSAPKPWRAVQRFGEVLVLGGTKFLGRAFVEPRSRAGTS